MARATGVCSTPGCPNPRPCPTHTPDPWAGSTRRTRTRSGWAQQADARTVMARHHRVCHVCGLPGADQVDHIIAVSAGGTDTIDNKAPIHSTPCHTNKTQAEATQGRRH